MESSGRFGRSLTSVALVVLVVLAGCAAEVDPGASPGASPGAGTGNGDGNGITVRVVGIVDGDTIEIRYENGTREIVRLIGVDTPEVHAPNEPAEFEGVPETERGATCLETWGHRASNVTRALLDERVRLSFDANTDRRGYYGRLLAYVHDDGVLFNYRLVAEGYARVYDSDFTKRERFYAAEAAAQREHRGLWTCARLGDATPVPDGGTTGLVVAEIHADAPGNDNENLNGEYVVLSNSGERAIELSGWTVSDEAGHSYAFPEGFTLGPDETVTLYTGAGTDDARNRYWGATGAIWNNEGDTVVVRDEGGQIVAKRSYG